MTNKKNGTGIIDKTELFNLQQIEKNLSGLDTESNKAQNDILIYQLLKVLNLTIKNLIFLRKEIEQKLTR